MFLKYCYGQFSLRKKQRKDVDCQQTLNTYIKLVMKERKQSGQNGYELTAEKIILTISYDVDNDDNDDDNTM